MISISSRRVLGVFVVLLLAATGAISPLSATTYTVNDATDTIHNGVGQCALTGSVPCGLNDLITYLNTASGGPHTISFSVPIVTFSTSLPQILKPMIIDGISQPPRAQIVGAPGKSSFDIQPTAGGVLPGSGTTIQNLVIRNMGSSGISIIGGGNQVFNCYIGVDSSGLVAANNGNGISITTPALGPFTYPPNLTGVGFNWIGNPGVPATGNVISGNNGAGITIFAERTVLNVVAFNKIGTDPTGALARPNAGHGVSISGNAFANTIGPGNIISGNNSPVNDGINISGAVLAPNVVTGNIIGPSSLLVTDLHNGRDGVQINSTSGDPLLDDVVELGPGNIIGYNGEHGVLLTGTCNPPTTCKVRVFGNFIGVAEDPSSAGTFLDLGNVLDGIRITTHGHKIGGSLLTDMNVISANNGSGIAITAGTTDVTIQGNIIGRDPLNVFPFPNTGDGITITDAGNNTIGGTASGLRNIIASNSGYGINITNSGASGNGWANLISGNSISGNTGLGINLDVTPAGVDPSDNMSPAMDPNPAYSNHGQNAPVVGTGVSAPHYDPSTGATTVNWTLETSASTPITLEFFASDAPGPTDHDNGQKYLGTITTTTAAITGMASGPTIITPSPAYDTRGKYISVTATPTDLEDVPGPTVSGPANNTSEFSNAVLVGNPGVVQFSQAIYTVGEAGPTALITVTRTGGSDGAISVDYTTSDNTATQPSDYLTASGTLGWADGDSASKTFTVSIVDDTVFEGPESLNLTLSNPGGFAQLGSPSSAVLNITDNDSQPTVSINDFAQAEGNSGTTPFTFNVTLSNASTQTITVQYATANGSATLADSDYVAASGTVMFLPGSTLQQVTVMVNGDASVEPDQTFFVNLTSPTNATILDNQGQGTIQNDDGVPSISIDDVSHLEGNSGTTSYAFNVTMSAPSASTVTVNFDTADNTATAASNDYQTTSGMVTFPAGSTVQTVTILVNGDNINEPDETFFVNLTSPVNAAVLDGQGLGTIQNDDPIPTISINDVSHLEGNSGTTPYLFNVTLSNPSSQTITVQYASADNSGTTAGNDYAPSGATLTFLPLSTSQPVTIFVNGDNVNEPDETFFVNLTSAVNATILDSQGLGTIQNDDPVPTISISDVSHLEGNSGTTPYVFNVTLSNPSSQTVTVQYATADNSATTADNDYVSASGTVTFPPLSTSQPVTVMANGDNKNEPDESFFVNLSTPANATILDNQGLGTIQNDDPVPAISISDVSHLEGNSGTTPYVFNVTLSNPSSQTVTVQYATADNSATVLNNDYVTGSGTVTFPPGSTSQPVTVVVNGDNVNEPDETFFVNLTTPVNATIGDSQGQGTIVNDDGVSLFTIDSVAHNEGASGTTVYTFTVTLTPAAASPTTVQATTADGTATVADNDYVANSQMLTFAAGVTTQTFNVTVNGDSKFETDETFTVNLSANSAGTAVSATPGTGTITNDDGQPTIRITSVSAPEGNSGTTPFVFSINLSNPSYQTITVNYATADGTATVANNDYTSAGGVATFGPGSVSQAVTVLVSGDFTVEPTETFQVNLTTPVNATILTSQGIGTITNDDNLGIPALGGRELFLLALFLAVAGALALRRL